MPLAIFKHTCVVAAVLVNYPSEAVQAVAFEETFFKSLFPIDSTDSFTREIFVHLSEFRMIFLSDIHLAIESKLTVLCNFFYREKIKVLPSLAYFFIKTGEIPRWISVENGL